MYDVITFGSASWDVFLKPKKFQIIGGKKFVRGKGLCLDLGSKIDLEDIFLFSGGGGTNVAATFVKQGFKTAYCGRVGDDIFGKEIIKELKELKIARKFVSKTKLKATNYSVIFNTGTKKIKTVLAYRGASGLLEKKDIPWKKLKAKWFYLAPLSGKLADITEHIVNFAYKNKIKIAFNPGKSQLSLPKNKLKRILKKVDVLFLNMEEASLLTKISYNKGEEIFRKLDEMVSGIAIIGSSEFGIMASDNKKIYKSKNSLTKIIDRTGAGDAFASGFVSGFIKKNDIKYAIGLGQANSSSCVKKWGAKQGLLKR